MRTWLQFGQDQLRACFFQVHHGKVHEGQGAVPLDVDPLQVGLKSMQLIQSGPAALPREGIRGCFQGVFSPLESGLQVSVSGGVQLSVHSLEDPLQSIYPCGDFSESFTTVPVIAFRFDRIV